MVNDILKKTHMCFINNTNQWITVIPYHIIR